MQVLSLIKGSMFISNFTRQNLPRRDDYFRKLSYTCSGPSGQPASTKDGVNVTSSTACLCLRPPHKGTPSTWGWAMWGRYHREVLPARGAGVLLGKAAAAGGCTVLPPPHSEWAERERLAHPPRYLLQGLLPAYWEKHLLAPEPAKAAWRDLMVLPSHNSCKIKLTNSRSAWSTALWLADLPEHQVGWLAQPLPEPDVEASHPEWPHRAALMGFSWWQRRNILLGMITPDSSQCCCQWNHQFSPCLFCPRTGTAQVAISQNLALPLSAVAVQGPCKRGPGMLTEGRVENLPIPATPWALVPHNWAYWTHSRRCSTGSGNCFCTFSLLPNHILGNLSSCNWRWCRTEACNREAC